MTCKQISPRSPSLFCFALKLPPQATSTPKQHRTSSRSYVSLTPIEPPRGFVALASRPLGCGLGLDTSEVFKILWELYPGPFLAVPRVPRSSPSPKTCQVPSPAWMGPTHYLLCTQAIPLIRFLKQLPESQDTLPPQVFQRTTSTSSFMPALSQTTSCRPMERRAPGSPVQPAQLLSSLCASWPAWCAARKHSGSPYFQIHIDY